jgi:hypothetical protein
MTQNRIFLKDARDTVTKQGTIDLTSNWRNVPASNSKRWRLALAHKRLALELEAAEKLSGDTYTCPLPQPKERNLIPPDERQRKAA